MNTPAPLLTRPGPLPRDAAYGAIRQDRRIDDGHNLSRRAPSIPLRRRSPRAAAQARPAPRSRDRRRTAEQGEDAGAPGRPDQPAVPGHQDPGSRRRAQRLHPQRARQPAGRTPRRGGRGRAVVGDRVEDRRRAARSRHPVPALCPYDRTALRGRRALPPRPGRPPGRHEGGAVEGQLVCLGVQAVQRTRLPYASPLPPCPLPSVPYSAVPSSLGRWDKRR
ncbi:hypothetical protein VTK73DRAFT_6289 [Phialemonium thermophilum]|uniref:Uncharacterized protein n=1 Tax=Phialemonium thermophilum TaxID=223376 RepID=A0ABR3V0V3_9PEZI